MYAYMVLNGYVCIYMYIDIHIYVFAYGCIYGIFTKQNKLPFSNVNINIKNHALFFNK